MTVAPVDNPQLRAQILDSLRTIDDSVKAQSALLNGCCDAEWLDDDSRTSVRWLLSALREHRRNLRKMSRVWRALGVDDHIDGELVAATADLLDEHRSFRPHLEHWRAAAVAGIRSDRSRFWRDMLDLAEANLRSAS